MSISKTIYVQEIARHVDTTRPPVNGVPQYTNRVTFRTTNPATQQGPAPIMPPEDNVSDADAAGFAEGAAVTVTYTPAS